MSQSFTTDRASFEQLVDSWQTYARSFVERSLTQDWEYRVPHALVGLELVKTMYVTVLDLQSQTKRKFLHVVQFEADDQEARATAWMEKFGDPTMPDEIVDLLRINCSGASAQLPGMIALFEEFIVNDASAFRMTEVIRSVGMEPTD